MDAGPDRGSGLLGANQPELVLVDPVLAEQARRLLPDVVELREDPGDEQERRSPPR